MTRLGTGPSLTSRERAIAGEPHRPAFGSRARRERNHSAIAAFGRMNRRPTRMCGISPRRSALRVDLSLRPSRRPMRRLIDTYSRSRGLVSRPKRFDGSRKRLAWSCPVRHPQRGPLCGRTPSGDGLHQYIYRAGGGTCLTLWDTVSNQGTEHDSICFRVGKSAL